MKKKIAGMIGMALVMGVAGCGSAENPSSGLEESGGSSGSESSYAEDSSVEIDSSAADETTEQSDTPEKRDDYSDVTFRIGYYNKGIVDGSSGLEWEPMMREIAENFKKQYPNLSIELVNTAGRTSERIGDMDVCLVGCYAGETKDMVGQDCVEPLDSYIASGRIDLSDVADAMKVGDTVNGEVYSVAVSVDTPCLVYDVEVLAGLDLSLSQTPTWSELNSVGAEVFEKTGKVVGTPDNFQQYIYSIGKTMFNQDGTDYGFEPEDLADYINYAVDFLKSSGAFPGMESWLSFSSSSQLWRYEQSGKPYAITAIPVADNAVTSGIYMSPVMKWAISAWSENKDLAADFINYFINDSSVWEVWGMEGGVPVSAAVREQRKSSGTESEICVLEYVSSVADKAIIPPEDNLDIFRSTGMESNIQFFASTAVWQDWDSGQLLEEVKRLLDESRETIRYKLPNFQ